MGNEIEFSSICDKVRYAVSFEEELTDEMREHIGKCDECRAYFEQTEKMTAELSALNVTSFNKNGMSVADGVMSEIKKQSVFTSGKPVKASAFIRHAGLIAACLVLVVMAIPVIKGMYGGAKSEDAAYKYKQNSTALYDVADDVADEECLPGEDAGEAKMMAAESYSGADNYGVVTESETELLADGVAFNTAYGTLEVAQAPESQNSVVEYRADLTDIYAYTEEYAKEFCVTSGLEYRGFESLTYSDDNTACAVYTTTSSEQVILRLEKNGDEWTVVNVEVCLK